MIDQGLPSDLPAVRSPCRSISLSFDLPAVRFLCHSNPEHHRRSLNRRRHSHAVGTPGSPRACHRASVLPGASDMASSRVHCARDACSGSDRDRSGGAWGAMKCPLWTRRCVRAGLYTKEQCSDWSHGMIVPLRYRGVVAAIVQSPSAWLVRGHLEALTQSLGDAPQRRAATMKAAPSIRRPLQGSTGSTR